MWNPFRRNKAQVDQDQLPESTRMSKGELLAIRPRKAVLPESEKRSLAAIVRSRMASEWLLASGNPNAVAQSACQIRRMARTLEETNPYAIQFLSDYENNVIGSGVNYQNKATTPRGLVDAAARSAVETAFKEWKKRPTVRAYGDNDGGDYDTTMRMVARSFARDGAVYVRKVTPWDNEWNFAIQLIDADMLAETLNISQMANGNRIIAGKEIDQWDRVVAYHFYESHPDEIGGGRRVKIVPASQIIDHYVTTRIGRFHGMSLLRGGIESIKQLNDFINAEIIAAKAGACAFASIERQMDSENPVINDESAPPIQSMEPGAIFDNLPPGAQLKLHKAEHPNTAAPEFRKMILRGVGTGWGVCYNSIGNDLEGVNYSSLREGKLRETDIWKMAQAHHIKTVEASIFNAWLKASLLVGAIPNYTILDLAKLSDSEWTGRRWGWVDPTKEIDSTVTQLGNKLVTMAHVLAERSGTDLEEHLMELAEEKKKFNAAGFKHPAEMAEDKAEADSHQQPATVAATPKIVKKESA